MKISPELMTIANMLTLFRLVCSPVLLFMAWHGYGIAFLLLLAAAFLSDALDGLAARLSGQVSDLGAKLDTYADVTLFLTISLSCWWLWPQVVRQEAVYVAVVITCFLLPGIVGYVKFRAATSYHTWLVKCALAAVGLSLYPAFLGGPVWPFKFATVLCVLAAMEEIAITIVSTQLHSNVRSLWNVLQRGNASKK
ncbi:CDP-alcohol phosphatidyltransferase family protein [Crenothrix sp.]|uniref:CDP-alcohol phosphatidyltransferase family protein n=1 Tax=Crenothrix sp. TaxID=3100433 RepID=UPI00374D2F90